MKRSIEKPFMTDDMIHVVLDIMNIGTSDYYATKNLLSYAYDSHHEKLYNGIKYEKNRE